MRQNQAQALVRQALAVGHCAADADIFGGFSQPEGWRSWRKTAVPGAAVKLPSSCEQPGQDQQGTEGNAPRFPQAAVCENKQQQAQQRLPGPYGRSYASYPEAKAELP